MTAIKRVYIGGLFHDITENDLKEKFKRFGEIDEIEIKHKRTAEGISEKTFAYINLKTSEADYQKCLSIFNKSKWKGFQLHLQLAKEDFIKRLKIERENGFKIEDDKKARKKNVVHNVLEDVPEVQNYTVKGAAPGTPVPGVKNWVVGKNGHVEPVVYLRRKDQKRTMKVDPSNYLKNHKKINKKEETTVKENITWELDEEDTDIVKKQKGEFPEWQPKCKKRRFSEYDERSNRSINDDFEVVRGVDTCSAPHIMNYSDSDSDSDYTSMKQKHLLNTVKSPQTNKHSRDPDSVSTHVGEKRGNTSNDKDRIKSNVNSVKEKVESKKQQKQNEFDKMKAREGTEVLGKQSELKMKKKNVQNPVQNVLTIENLKKHTQSTSDNEMSDADSVSSVGTDEIIKKTKDKVSKTINSPLTSLQLGKYKYLDEFSSGMLNGNNEADDFSDLVDDDSLDGENYEFLAKKIEAEYRNKNSNTQAKQVTENANISLTRSAEQSSSRKSIKGKKTSDEGRLKGSKSENLSFKNEEELQSVSESSTSSDHHILESKKNCNRKIRLDTSVSSDGDSDDESTDFESNRDFKNFNDSESESDSSDDDFPDMTSDESSDDLKKIKDTRKTDVRSHSLKGIPAFRGTKDLYTERSNLDKETDKVDGSAEVVMNQITGKTKYDETNDMIVETDGNHLKQCKQNDSVKKVSVIRDEIELKKESNQKRLESIKQRQQETKVQKLVIKQALSNVDKANTPNKKIVFDSDSEDERTAPSGVDLIDTDEDSDSEDMDSDSTTEDEVDSDSSTQNESSSVKTQDKKQTLFDSSDDDDRSEEDGKSEDEKMFRIRPEFEGKAGKKLIELQSRYKNDERFKLDERFRDEDNDDPEDDSPHNEGDEKLRSLKILREVVGKKAVISIDKDAKNKKLFKDMSALHFDPSREDHSQFEVKTSRDNDKKSSDKVLKKKKKKKEEQLEDVEEEEELPEVSKERFYEVTSSFKDAFGDKKEDNDDKVGSFSLLTAFGQTSTAAESDTEEEEQGNTLIPTKGGEFLWQQPFKYDSSDSNDEEDDPMDSVGESQAKKPNVVVFGTKPTAFFFSENDERIKEGILSFCRQKDESVIREQWQQKRQQLVDGYRTKHKRLTRRKKQNEKFRHQFQK